MTADEHLLTKADLMAAFDAIQQTIEPHQVIIVAPHRRTWAEWLAQLEQERLGASMARDVERAAFIENGGNAISWALLQRKLDKQSKHAPGRRSDTRAHKHRVSLLGKRRFERMRLIKQLVADGLYEED